MKKIIGIIAIVLIVLGVYYYYENIEITNENEKNNIIKIGANLPLTGEVAVYGQNDKKGMDLALSESQLNVKIVYEDNKGTAKDAVQAAKKLINDGVIAVIDDAISGISLATIPIYEKSQIPLISTGSTNPSLSGISPFFFRIWNSDTEEGDFAAKTAFNKLEKRRVVILFLNSDYGNGLKNVFEDRFTKLGGEVVASVSFEENIMDFRSLINKFKGDDFDLLYIIGYAPQTGPLVKKIREQKINKKILSTVATEDSKFLELAGEAADGVLYVFNKTPSGENYQHFISAFKEKYNENPQLLTDVGYDVVKLVLMAIENGARSGEQIKNFLSKMGKYEGASGLIKFDENGDVHKPMVLKEIKDNNFELFK